MSNIKYKETNKQFNLKETGLNNVLVIVLKFLLNINKF